MKTKDKISELDKLNTDHKWQIIDNQMPHWSGYLKKDPTLLAYFYFKDKLGNKWKCRSYQDIILNDPSKRICVCISRQMGKTSMAAIMAFYKAYFTDRSTTVVVSATKPQAMELIRRIKDFMQSSDYGFIFETLAPSKRDSKSEIILKEHGTESRIISIPATDAGRGYTADLVIVDEAAFIENGDYIFHQVIEPMTQATEGNILLLSTPNGRQGFFYDCFKSEYWSSYQFGWWENSENTEEKMKIKRSTMTALAFQSEYEANFNMSESSYFHPNEINSAVSELAGHGALPNTHIAVGVDFGKIHDKCVIHIGEIINPNDTPDKHIIRLVERRVKPLGTNYAQIIGELKDIGKRINPTIFALDATGVGEGPSDILIQETGLNIEPVKFSIQKKLDIFSNLKVLFEQKRIQIPKEKELISQLELFQYEYTQSGNIKLHAPEGEHDDECDALALMAWGLTRAINPPVTLRIIK